MSRLLALYPAPWRARYEEEFLALLAERPPRSLAERADIVRGAIDAHLHPQVAGPALVRDRVGVVVLAGFASFWMAIGIAINGPVHHDSYGSYRDGGAALPFLLVSMVLLSAGLYRIIERLPAESGRAAIAGAMAMIAGPLWGIAPWLLPVGAVFAIGTAALLIGAARAGVVPWWTAAVTFLGLAPMTTLFAAAFVLPWYALRTSGVEAILFIGPLGLAWAAIGVALLRGFAPSTDTATVA